MSRSIEALNSKTNEEVYIEYVNDFLTTEYMANYYNVDTEYLTAIIEKGRQDHYSRFES